MGQVLLIAQCLMVLWSAADLSYQLHSGQAQLLDEFRSSAARRFVVCCSRRWGKSWWACSLAIEEALRRDNARICYACPTQKMARSIVEPTMRKLLADCPAEYAPKHNRTEATWTFPNGSVIVLAGCDNGNAEKLRGTSMDLGIVDEAGFVDELEYVVQDVLLPQTITTNGRMVLISTPSRSPEHAFVRRYMLDAEARGELVVRTIYDAPHISEETIEEYKAECGGEESSTWQREYLAKPVVDETRAIVPEFMREEDVLVAELDAEEFMDRYVIADFGFSDLTVVGFWEWHFKRSLMYQRAELVFQNTGAAQMAPEILAMERELWGGEQPRDRYGDADQLVLADLNTEHGLTMALPRKDDKDAQINALRLACTEHRAKWHPDCKTTIAHMRAGIWNKSRRSFERSGEFGHFDGVDQSIYAVRHIDRSRNPWPRNIGINQDTHHIPSTGPSVSPTGNTIRDAFRGSR